MSRDEKTQFAALSVIYGLRDILKEDQIQYFLDTLVAEFSSHSSIECRVSDRVSFFPFPPPLFPSTSLSSSNSALHPMIFSILLEILLLYLDGTVRETRQQHSCG